MSAAKLPNPIPERMTVLWRPDGVITVPEPMPRAALFQAEYVRADVHQVLAKRLEAAEADLAALRETATRAASSYRHLAQWAAMHADVAASEVLRRAALTPTPPPQQTSAVAPRPVSLEFIEALKGAGARPGLVADLEAEQPPAAGGGACMSFDSMDIALRSSGDDIAILDLPGIGIGYKQGRADERAAVVAHLRQRADKLKESRISEAIESAHRDELRKLQARVALLEAVAEAARCIWIDRRPCDWSEEDHLRNPCVNANNRAESDLFGILAALGAAGKR